MSLDKNTVSVNINPTYCAWHG